MSVASSVLALLVGIIFVAAGVRDAAASAVLLRFCHEMMLLH